MALTRRDYQLLAMGWDAAIKSMRYEDGAPVEIAMNENPYAQYLEDDVTPR